MNDGQTSPEQFAELAMSLHDLDVEATLSEIVELARVTLDCDQAGVHERVGRTLHNVAATQSAVARADALQNELGEGPCLDAAWQFDTFVVENLHTDPRWPRFAEHAPSLGLGAVLSVRLADDEQTLGALNLYSVQPRHFDSEAVSLAHVFGRHAGIALSTARRDEGLRRSVDARHRVGLAQGILMERFGLSSEQSFAVLRRYSQDNNVKLRDVADQIITTRELPDVSET